jgi:hypothetical protein
MWKNGLLTGCKGLYTDESPGLKVDPVVVMTLSVVFIFSVVALHGMCHSLQVMKASPANETKSSPRSCADSPHRAAAHTAATSRYLSPILHGLRFAQVTATSHHITLPLFRIYFQLYSRHGQGLRASGKVLHSSCLRSTAHAARAGGASAWS